MLGGLLSQRTNRPGGNPGVLGQVLSGVAAASAQKTGVPAGPAGSLVEGLVRDSIMRHHHAGGQVPQVANSWVQNYPYGQPVPHAHPHGHPGYPQGYQQGFPPGYMPGYPQAGYPQPTRGAPVPAQDVPRDADYSHMTHDQRGEILIQAMIMAAQADGQIDSDEQNRILQQLQPLTQPEVDYLNRAFSTRHDVEAFVATIPRGMEHEVYQVSLMAINLDNQPEMRYIQNLATALRIGPQDRNHMHSQYGLPAVF
jgi:hypothetical protein